MFSPYSPYGNGEKAVYKEAQAEEKTFWKKLFNECKRRIEKVPTFLTKKTWFNNESTMRTFADNMRETMNRMADVSSNPAQGMHSGDEDKCPGRRADRGVERVP